MVNGKREELMADKEKIMAKQEELMAD